ncbi:MAG: conserved phage C-terminal domain-containing protein [Porphyromonadaceae bacterium]|nr:conserved phage C-terminal domain-containing protein [Porphyromonadaceae bacterium]
MSPFCKLDSGITKSSLWSESLHVRVVFLSFLAEKDDTGFVSASRSGMIRTCNVTPDQFDDACTVLSSPDPDSKSQDFEGRRIEKVEGGWIVLNSDKYRLPENEKKESHAAYMREWRSKRDNVNSREITENHKRSPSVSVSVSVSESVSDKNEELIKSVIGLLNYHCGTSFRPESDNSKRFINARIREGFTLDDFKAVILFKKKEWYKTDQHQYLRPQTLFGTKFESYLNGAKLTPEKPEQKQYLPGIDPRTLMR